MALAVWGSLVWSLLGVSRGCFLLLSLRSVLCSLFGGWVRRLGPRGWLRRAGGWRSAGARRWRGRCGRSGRCLLLLASPAARRSVGPPSSGAPGRVACPGVGARVRARLRPRPAVGFPCSPFLLVASLGGAPWSLSRLAPPLSSLSRVGRCRRCSCALVALARRGCWSPASGRWRRPRPSPAAPPSGRVAPWRSALALVAPLANGRSRARCPGRRRVAPLARVACCLWWVGSAACPPLWRALACRAWPRGRPWGCSRGGVAVTCSSACFPRCASCPPSSPAGAPVPLVRCAPVARWFAPCPLCGALGLVLSASGAARPFLWCAWCGVAAPAPARLRWSSSPVAAAVQPSLF